MNEKTRGYLYLIATVVFGVAGLVAVFQKEYAFAAGFFAGMLPAGLATANTSRS
jgi:hypothetical protein